MGYATPQQCAITLVPLPGESADGWFRSLAIELKCGVSDIATEAGLPRKWIMAPCRVIAAGVPAECVEGLAALTGLEASLLTDLGLAVRTHTKTVEPALRLRGQPSMVALSASRYCPQCLASNGGRWLAFWRLPWLLVCPNHGCMLEIECPEGHHQCQRPMPLGTIPHQLRHCLDSRGWGPSCRPTMCGADLSVCVTRAAPEPLSLLTTRLAGLCDPRDPSFDTSLVLLQRFLLVARSEAAHRGVEPPPLAFREADSLDLLTLAAEAALDPCGESMRIAATRDRSRYLLPRSWKAPDDEARNAAVVARRDRLSVIDHLRWSITPTGATPPSLGQEDAYRMADRLPRSLWHGWTVALVSTPNVFDDDLRSAAIFGLQVAASSAELNEIAASVDIDDSAILLMRRKLRELHRRTDGVSTLALIELARALRAQPAPIDYARRRRVVARGLLIEESEWTSMANRLGIGAGGPFRLAAVRAWLWACITGEPIADVPERIVVGASHGRLDNFLAGAPPLLFSALREYAQSFLREHGAGMEPLEWEPPLELVAGSVLPGRRPDDIDKAGLRRLLDRGVAPTSAARELGVTLTHVRLALCSGNVPPRADLVRRRSSSRTYVHAGVSRELLVDLLWVQSLSLRRASAMLKTSRKTLGEACRRLGVEVPAPGRRSSIDLAWVQSEYLDKGKSFAELALQLNMGPNAVSRFAAHHGIPARPRGARSHSSNRLVREDLPPLLASCMRGQSAEQRLERFEVASGLRSFCETARTLCIAQSTVSGQVANLACAAGGALVVPSRGSAPLVLTDLGQELLSQYRQYRGREVDSSTVAEPLRSALRLYRAEMRLAKWLPVVETDNLNDAVLLLGSDASTLRRGLKNLERDLGFPIVRLGPRPSRSIQPTNEGRLLKEQFDQASIAA